MHRKRDLPFFLLAIAVLLFTAAYPAYADVDQKAASILDKMDAALHPDGLQGYRCGVNLQAQIAGGVSLESSSTALEINYIAPYDFRVEFHPGVPQDMEFNPIRLRGDDPFLLANPALKQALPTVYDISFDHDDDFNGERCHVLHLVPIDQPTKPASLFPFDLYIRISDLRPVHTVVYTQSSPKELRLDTDIVYEENNGFTVVSNVTTYAPDSDSAASDELFFITTDFVNYEINPESVTLLSGNAAQEDEDETYGGSFDDIYDGFASPAITAELMGEHPLYSKLKFAFALEIPSNDVTKELASKHDEIIDAIKAELGKRRWGDISDSRYELGEELLGIINDIITSGEVTDFYFTIYEPLR